MKKLNSAKADEKVEHLQAFYTTNELDEAFKHWWFNEGSEMPPLPDEDHGFHTRRIARIAWHNGADRPPIGIEPEFNWKKKRLHDLLAEVKRYNDLGRKANAEWYSEIAELTDVLERKARAAWYPQIDKLINDLNDIKDLKEAMRMRHNNNNRRTTND